MTKLACLSMILGLCISGSVVAAESCADMWERSSGAVVVRFDRSPTQNENLPRNKYLEIQNRDQLQFFLNLGAQVTPNSVTIANPEDAAQRYNQMVRTYFFAQSYVSQETGLLIFRKWGDAAPANAVIYEPRLFRIHSTNHQGRTIYVQNDQANHLLPPATNILADADFIYAHVHGFFPGAMSDDPVVIGNSSQEPLVFHDLAHAGGYASHADVLPEVQKALQRIWSERDGVLSETVLKRLFFINEGLPAMKRGSQESLHELLDQFEIDVFMFGRTGASRQEVAKISTERLSGVAKSLIDFHWEQRAPFGAGIRTAGTSIHYLSRVDRLATALTAELQYFEKNRNDVDSENAVRELIANFIFLMSALSETTIPGWMSLAGDETAGAARGPYERFLCSQVYGDMREMFYAEFFCQ